MKKGISLIVLVITIIVMIIIAGAIIISLNSSNVIDKANEAVTESDLANARNACMLAYAELAAGNDGTALYDKDKDGTVEDTEIADDAYYYNYLVTNKFGKDLTEVQGKYTVTADSNGIPKVDKAS